MTKTELNIAYPSFSCGEVNVRRKLEYINYKYGLTDNELLVKDLGWEIYLDHQCDDWIIGNIESAQKMRDDLELAFKYCVGLDKPPG